MASGAGAWGQTAPEKTLLRELPRINEVHIDGLAVLKIIKHCSEALPNMVAGSLLGLDQNTTLEVTHSFPFPTPKKDIVEAPEGASSTAAAEEQVASTGHDYQIEMMKMLREVNIDNNCVGWYQSMYLGSFCTSTLIENQFSYQDNLSDNAVVILYDPVQTARGQLTLKAYRLSKEFMRAHRERRNDYIKPSEILDELPIRIRNPGLINALIYDLRDRGAGGDVDFERLDLSTNPYLEKNLESLCSWIDDLANEQWKFQSYTRGVLKQRHDAARWADRRKKTNDERRAAGEEALPDDDAAFAEKRFDAPNRMESLLISTQISAYCSQINKFAGSSFEKLFLAGSLQKEAA